MAHSRLDGATEPRVHRTLSDAQRIAWLRLIRCENVGPVTFRDLVNQFGSASDALVALPDLSRRGGRGKPIHITAEDDALAELDRAKSLNAHLVAIGERGYPPWLAQIDAPPPLVFIKGRRDLADRPIISIVGSRNSSAAGLKIARMLTIGLGVEGFVIASGMARGIDGAVHHASLERGTIAVIAGGIDIVYPPEHRALHDAIASTGLLVTERPPGLEPRAVDFPRRNRIISGIAMGIVVVEAAKRSGSLITARFAAEQGREVFAVPGHPLDPRAEGTNGLLKNGATLTATASDIIDVLRPLLTPTHAMFPSRVSEQCGEDDDPLGDADIAQDARVHVIRALGPTPIDLDEIARATGLSVQQVRVVALELDLAGRIERHAGNHISLIYPDN